MAIDGRTASEREQTDQSLRVERQQLDRALVEQAETLEGNADDVVSRARENADAVLLEARDKADRVSVEARVPSRSGPFAETPTSAVPSAKLVEKRVMEDTLLREERASEDAALRRAREANARLLLYLLPLERDKTDRDLLTERARSDDALSSRDDFLGIVSHDLRNLLCGVVMSASLLSERVPQNEHGKRLLEETSNILNCASRMNRMIGDLIDVVSIDAGKLSVVLADGDLKAVLLEVADMFRATAASQGIALQVELGEGPLRACFDHGRVLQVLTNLVTNAIKFSSRGDSIGIRAERSRDGARVSITDGGLGVPNAMLETIFERFAQVGRNDRRGLGLGLYISRCLVEAHGGRIYAESPEGGGSTFCFTLPPAVS